MRLAALQTLQMRSCVKRLGLELAGELANLVIVSVIFNGRHHMLQSYVPTFLVSVGIWRGLGDMASKVGAPVS